MNNQERITKREHKLSPDLWEELDNLNASNVEELIESLEKYVSNGFFGAAAELSDTLESCPYIDKNPSWRVRVELERMKRYYCLGFENLMITSSNRVLGYLEHIYPKKSINDNYLLWRGTAVGHQGWIISKPNELEKIIKQCKDIRDKFQNEKDKDDRTCFIYALEGRLFYLRKDYATANECFVKAIRLAENNRFLRSSAHIKIIYAEHLALQNEWEKVVTYANEFLLNAAELQFKTHLLIRAFILLLQAPIKYLINKEEDFQHYVFRYQILLHAMGLSQSQNLNPLLAKAKEIIPKNKLIDFYYADLRTELKRRILEIAVKKNKKNKKTGEGFEKLIKLYYELLNYQVFKLPDDFEAIDLIAVYSMPKGEKSFTAIQVKSGKAKITKRNLSDYSGKLSKAKEELETGKYTGGMRVKSLSGMHWYSIETFHKHAFDILMRDVENYFGKDCIVETTNIDKLVDTLLSKYEILVKIIFSKELEIE